MPRPIDADAANTNIESYIGAPVPEFDIESDNLCISIYNYFKPAILYFFYLCNNPFEEDNRNDILYYMEDLRNAYGDDFFQHAANLGLVPEGPFDGPWVQDWFSDLFSQDEAEKNKQVSIVVQGGEAVNFYSMNKYDTVPTHDADTRIMMGNNFTYLKQLRDVPADIRKKMHKYRFFVGFCLHSVLEDFHYYATKNPEGDDIAKSVPYTAKFIPDHGDDMDVELEFDVVLGGEQFYNSILDESYDIDDDENLAILLCVDATYNQGGFKKECGLVDIFIPYKTDEASRPYDRVGQSNNIHSYFATDQAKKVSIPPQAEPNPAGYVPSIDEPFIIPDSVPYLSDKIIDVRLVPLGFILFETLRMLFVSDVFKSHGYTRHKLLKYKQKLNVLLSTLLNSSISANTLELCFRNKSNDAATAGLLVGGRVLEASSSGNKIEYAPGISSKAINTNTMLNLATSSETTPTNTTATPASVAPTSESQKTIEQQAREYSRSIKKDSEPNPDTLSEVEWLGYMDYLSYLHPDFKDYRLPLLPIDFEERKNKMYNRNNESVESAPVKKGGYRHKTQKKHKNKIKSKRTTQRK